MKKIITSIFIMLVLLFCAYEILSESETIMNSVTYSFDIWANNLFPSLFPFFVLSEILVNYGFVELVSELFKPIFTKLFKSNSNASFVFIMSMLSGFPSNAKYTRQLYLDGKLTDKEASKILMFTHFPNPLFVLGTVSITFLNNKSLGIIILISLYLSNIIIGILFRNYNPTDTKEKFSFKNCILMMHNKRVNNNKTFGFLISNSLINAINTLLLILGVVTTFLIITTIIDNNFHPDLLSKTFISGFLEMTQGLKHVSLLNISLNYKTVLITMILAFGGLSVHTQALSIISDTKIKYKPFLLARLIHIVLSSIICTILLIFNN